MTKLLGILPFAWVLTDFLGFSSWAGGKFFRFGLWVRFDSFTLFFQRMSLKIERRYCRFAAIRHPARHGSAFRPFRVLFIWRYPKPIEEFLYFEVVESIYVIYFILYSNGHFILFLTPVSRFTLIRFVIISFLSIGFCYLYRHRTGLLPVPINCRFLLRVHVRFSSANRSWVFF